MDPADFVQPLVGQIVSSAWRGAGTAIFVEVGPLAEGPSRTRHPRGKVGSIGIEWSWRVEDGHRILLGSFSEDQWINELPGLLKGLNIRGISFFGMLPEIEVQLSDGTKLVSFSTVEGDPQWSIRIGKSWLSVRSGKFVFGGAA
jgi:hypothetical protein